MQLSELLTDIKDEINRGSRVTDAQVKQKIRDALVWVEQRYTWEYMDRYQSFALNTSSEQPRVIPMPNSGGVKKIEFIKFVDTNDDGNFKEVVEITPRSIKSYQEGLPEGYFKDGMEYIWFDKTPDENYQGEISYAGFTNWVDSDTFSPWPFKYMRSLIKHQTLVLLAPFLRDEGMLRQHSALLQDALKTAQDQDEELRYSNYDNQMEYRG